ncbi:MAG: hypothetical protein GX126_07005 [Bacteroidales bacterium]|jgi:DUF1680 family protein|nr:hypothetical protein [Bacteroidales bacterium]
MKITTAFLISFLLVACNRKESNNLPVENNYLHSVSLTDVKVEGEIGRRIDSTINNNLLKISIAKDFILPFTEKKSKGGYIGVGKLIDASVKFAGYSGNPKVIEVKDHLIGSLLETVEADGYIGIMEKNSRVKQLWDIHEMGYIILGLVNDYRYFQNQKSLDAAVRLADYIIKNWSEEICENWKITVCHVGVTGFDRALLALYEATGDQDYINFLVEELGVPDWEGKVVLGRKMGVEGHIYAYMARTVAQLELSRLSDGSPDFTVSEKAMKQLTEEDAMLISGGAGQWECWTNDQDGAHALGETCATAYQLRFYETLFRMKKDPFYGDLMERTIYNALFAAQSPDGRRIRYYTPIEGARQFFEGDTYCCPNNYRRIIAELPAFLYYKFNKGIAINLYHQSEAIIDISGENMVNIRQITDYPNSGSVTIIVSPSKPQKFSVLLRIPLWADEATVSHGNNADQPAEPGTFFRVEQVWNQNDTINLEMPMDWRFIKGRKRQFGRVAVMRGPVLYCFNPELNRGKGLDTMDSYELGRLFIDPGSVKGPLPCEHVRPDGTKCVIGAWKEGHSLGDEHDFELVLTEFIDPDGKAVYFSRRDAEFGIDDELFIVK